MVPVQQELPLLPLPRLMPMADSVPRVPNQPVPFQGLVNPGSLDIRLIGTLPGYDTDIDDVKQPDMTTR